MHMGRTIRFTLGFAVGALSGCGSFGKSQDSGASESPAANGAAGGGFDQGPTLGFGGSSSTGGAAGVPLPPEKETNATFELPHAGENFVYAANTDSDTVAVIDARNLAIQIVQAGDKPRFLQTLAHSDSAIVLNVGSFDATIIRTDASTGVSRTSSALVKPGSNAIAVADDGKHAIVYFDANLPSESSTPGNPQDATVITLDPNGDTYNGMSIGSNPSRVFFSSDQLRAFLVTDEGVTILDFADIDKKANGVSQKGAGIARTVPLGNTGVDKTLDVSVTPDGKYALAREEGTSELRLVDLETELITKLDVAPLIPVQAGDAGAHDAGTGHVDSGAPSGISDGGTDAGRDADATPPKAPAPTPPPPAPALPATITDLDVAASGAFVIAVVRDRNAVARIPVPEAFTDHSKASVTVIPDELIGSVSLAPDETHALLYTTAVDTVKRLTIVDLAGGSAPRTVQLKKAIESVAIAPDSKTAVILNKKVLDDPNDTFGYTLLQIDSGYAKLMVTATAIGPFTLVPDHLLVLFNDGTSIREVHNVDLGSFLVTPIELGSPPTSVGALPGLERAFVGQDHPDGRISFIDWATSGIQTVTGFELNSRIRQ